MGSGFVGQEETVYVSGWVMFVGMDVVEILEVCVGGGRVCAEGEDVCVCVGIEAICVGVDIGVCVEDTEV